MTAAADGQGDRLSESAGPTAGDEKGTCATCREKAGVGHRCDDIETCPCTRGCWTDTKPSIAALAARPADEDGLQRENAALHVKVAALQRIADGQGCTCPTNRDNPADYIPCPIHDETAARAADEDGLRAAKAQAWDEGLLFGQQHWATNYGAYQNSTPTKAPNPYRAHPEPTAPTAEAGQ